MRRFTALILLTCWCIRMDAAEPVFFKTTVREGDGIFSLLKRYDLNDRLSTSKFCDLNALTLESALIQGKAYILPLLVYAFDGRSIRSTIGINDWDLAVRIAAYNNTLVERGLREASYQETGELWVPYRDLTGKPMDVKVTPGVKNTTMHEPLFGESYETVEAISQKLKGKVFYIVSGHGGPDPGAMAEVNGNTLCEDEYAYDVSLRLARNLMEHGATVEMIVQDPNDGIRSERYLNCDKDEYTQDKRQMPINQLARLRMRCENVNQLSRSYEKKGMRDQTVICIHVDSQGPRSRQDVYFYYLEGSKTGRQLAITMQETFEEKYHQKRAGRGYEGTVTSRGLYELRHTDPPAVYIELANIQNTADLKRLLPDSNRQAVANWLCDGILKAKGE